jgi:hypothetical protein
MELLGEVAREALDGAARKGLGRIAQELRSGWGTLLKPLAGEEITLA